MFKKPLIIAFIVIALGFIPKSTSIICIKKKAVKDKVSIYSIDRYNNIYYSDKNQVIHKIDTNLQNKLFYSSKTPNQIDLLEAWNGLNIFVFHKDAQEVKFLDRFLTLKTEISLENEVINFADLAAPSYDNNIWIWDNIDFSIKKYDFHNKKLLVNNRLDLLISDQDYHPIFLKEYQNRVYLQDSTAGIIVFDNMGNYKTKLPIHSSSAVNFIDNYLVYELKDSLCKYHLYDYQTSMLEKPAGRCFLLNKNKVASFDRDSLFIYHYKD